jgi:hypothetical protein
MNKIIFILDLALAGLVCKAQQTDAEKDVLKLMQVNGSAASYDLAYDQIVAQFKMMKPNVPQFNWDMAKRDVFDKEIIELQKQLIPVYLKSFTPEEVKQLIAFYTSPLGKKLVGGTTQVSKESMKVAQPWAMSLTQKLQAYLTGVGM